MVALFLIFHHQYCTYLVDPNLAYALSIDQIEDFAQLRLAKSDTNELIQVNEIFEFETACVVGVELCEEGV